MNGSDTAFSLFFSFNGTQKKLTDGQKAGSFTEQSERAEIIKQSSSKIKEGYWVHNDSYEKTQKDMQNQKDWRFYESKEFEISEGQAPI